MKYIESLSQSELNYLESKGSLKLNLHKEFFDAIKSGEKTEEYRTYNDYWESRIEKFAKDGVFLIEFKNGYSATAPKFKALCLYSWIEKALDEDGDEYEFYTLEVYPLDSFEIVDELPEDTEDTEA